MSSAICINSPSNPVGWTATLDELKAVRDECRKRGLWIVGDEVYARFYYGDRGEKRAPSFLDVCDTEERLLLANTFSKNWAMTGWRVGWLQAPKALGPAIERIIQYNTSGTATFLQRGCIAALDHGEDFITAQVAKARANPGMFDDFRKANAKKFRGFDAPEHVIRAIETAVAKPYAEGVLVERQLFLELMSGTQAKAQQYFFFAERKAAKVDNVPENTQPRDIKRVGVIGAGTMGGGISMNFLSAGVPVTIVVIQAKS